MSVGRRQPLLKELVRALLAVVVERRRHFVEKDPLRLVEEDTGDRQALLLMRRQLLVPQRGVVEAGRESIEADQLERLADLRIAERPG